MSPGAIRKARIEDVKQIQKVINLFAKQDVMLPRSLSELYENMRDFWVAEENNKVVGCCALHITWSDLSEIKSLAVKKSFQGKNIGAEFINACIKEARELGCKSIFVLTYIPEYFKRFGFRRISKERLPHKIWADCISCPKFPDCKEVALIKKI